MPRDDPAACVDYCQNRYQACMAKSHGSSANCGGTEKCDKIDNPELKGACLTSIAYRSPGIVCGEQLDGCMASCN